MESFFQDLVSFTANQDLWTVFLLLLWCVICEAGIAIPYVLESFWLLVGFNVGIGVISPWYIVLLWFAAQAGRQTGNMGLYRIARFGVPTLEKFFHKVHLDKFFDKIKSRSGAAQRLNLTSPFSIAFGRMVGMRIPMMLVMAGKKKPGMLALGVLLSSIVWDTLYISIGAVFGSTASIAPGYMLLISLGCIGAIYLMTWVVKKLIRSYRLRYRQPVITAVDIAE